MTRVAVIDIGTVTARLAVSEVECGRVVSLKKLSTICNLGQDVDQTGLLRQDAMDRVLAAVDGYLAVARDSDVSAICCTLTSAARDASNSKEFLGEFSARGLQAQVIAGEVEGSLTLLGVAQDFVGKNILVADNGGGSTELAYGAFDGRELKIGFVRSLDVGCRRITERYLSNDDPPREGDLVRAHLFCADAFERGITLARKTLPGDFSPERLVVCGGTSTSLVAINLGLVPYDSSKVHLSELAEDDVTGIEEMLASITEAQRAQVPGIQPKRAPVILGGVIAIRELMRKCLFDRMTVSESDLLVGLSIACAAAVDGLPSPIGWAPSLSLV